jgi:hypothetical protein
LVAKPNNQLYNHLRRHSAVIDLVLSPLFLEAGQERKELPGLYVSPPRKSARLRANDRAILFLAQSGSETLPHNIQQELLARLSETYYTSNGSVTFGMKAMADRLNDFLINRNLRQSRQQGGQAIGIINMVVLHGNSLYIGHAGPTHTYLITNEHVEHYTDASGVGRSLGLARLVSLRFFQTTFEPGACLLLSSIAAPGWDDAGLVASASLESSAMRKQLQNGLIDLQACFLRTAAGKGQVRWDYTSTPSTAPIPAQSPAPVPSAPITPSSSISPPTPRWVPDLISPDVPLENVAPELVSPAPEGIPEPPSGTPIQGVYLSGKPLEEPLSDRAPWEETVPASAVAEVPVVPVPDSIATQPVEVRAPERVSRQQPVLTPSRSTAPAPQVSPSPRNEPANIPDIPARKRVPRPSPAKAGLARF